MIVFLILELKIFPTIIWMLLSFIMEKELVGTKVKFLEKNHQLLRLNTSNRSISTRKRIGFKLKNYLKKGK